MLAFDFSFMGQFHSVALPVTNKSPASNLPREMTGMHTMHTQPYTLKLKLHMQRSEKQLLELVPSFHHVGPGD